MEIAAMPRRGGGAAGGWLVDRGPLRNRADSGDRDILGAPATPDGLS